MTMELLFSLIGSVLSFIGFAIILLSVFKRSIPDIVIIAAFGLYSLPTLINSATVFLVFKEYLSAALVISTLLDIACVGFLALYCIICMTSLLPGIASMIKGLWFTPAVFKIIVFLLGRLLAPAINVPAIGGVSIMPNVVNWALMIGSFATYLGFGFLSANRCKLTK